MLELIPRIARVEMLPAILAPGPRVDVAKLVRGAPGQYTGRVPVAAGGLAGAF